MSNRSLNRLTALHAAKLKTPGRHADGGGLYLFIDGTRRRWSFLYTWRGKKVELGIGSTRDVSLAAAREKAGEYREFLLDGKNPKTARTKRDRHILFGDFADEYIATMEPGWRNPKHAAQWKMTITKYAQPIRDLVIEDIDAQDILKVLTPHWLRVPETAQRLRGRIEMILDAAKALGLRDGENPARWRGNIKQLLPKQRRGRRGHHAALPYWKVQRFVGDLRSRPGLAARALEFTILTAARTSEVLLADWREFDLPRKTWVIPADRMKMGIEHRVPLSSSALSILLTFPESERSGLVFTRSANGLPLTNMAMPMLLRRMQVEATVHGFRSTFRDWAAEETHTPNEVCEMALSHAISGDSEAAYRRGDLFTKRRKLMENWAAYCTDGDTS